MKIVIDIPEETYKRICGYSLHHIDFCYTEDVALLAIKNGIPYEERKGKWIIENRYSGIAHCSECGLTKDIINLTRYCEDCGAKMEVDNNA